MTTILLVESNAVVRLQGAEVIAAAGFRVIETDTIGDALRKLTDCPEIAIVVTGSDQRSGLDGIALAHQVFAGWPPVRLLVTSGDRLVKPEDLPSEARVLLKPYSDDELVTALHVLEKQWRSRLL